MFLYYIHLLKSLINFLKNDPPSTLPNTLSPESERLLAELNSRIQELPMRQDLRRLLKKSIFGLFVGIRVESEVVFLNDVR